MLKDDFISGTRYAAPHSPPGEWVRALVHKDRSHVPQRGQAWRSHHYFRRRRVPLLRRDGTTAGDGTEHDPRLRHCPRLRQRWSRGRRRAGDARLHAAARPADDGAAAAHARRSVPCRVRAGRGRQNRFASTQRARRGRWWLASTQRAGQGRRRGWGDNMDRGGAVRGAAHSQCPPVERRAARHANGAALDSERRGVLHRELLVRLPVPVGARHNLRHLRAGGTALRHAARVPDSRRPARRARGALRLRHHSLFNRRPKPLRSPA
mmetsp:Transcript_42478/g.137823  ORF Transcript_42478/g.137823 Transcript_42478/m.137823 type:complete len:265 (+) Transcript_42478:850-1644(+)